MKKFFTVLVLALVALTTQANYDDGQINITNMGRQSLRIEVDGRRYNDDGQTAVIRNLSPGYHTVKIYADKNNNGSWGWSDIFGKKRAIYNNSIYVKPRTLVDIVINRAGRISVDEQYMGGRYDRGNGKNGGYNNRGNGRNGKDDGYYDRGNGRNGKDDGNFGGDNRGNGKDDGYYNDDNTYRRPMDERSFLTQLETLRRIGIENSKMNMARQMFNQDYFSTDQVKRMLELFSFENNRLELAKYAYPNTTDKNNYFRIYDVFSYTSSRDDLADFIRRYR